MVLTGPLEEAERAGVEGLLTRFCMTDRGSPPATASPSMRNLALRGPIPTSLRVQRHYPSNLQLKLEGHAMQVPAHFFGVDVAKVDLVCAHHGHPAIETVQNQAKPIDDWLASLPEGSAIAVESTGGLERLLVTRAVSRGIPVFLVDARKTRNFAIAIGRRGKTDPIDAASLAHFLAVMHAQLHVYRPPTPEQEQIDQLLRSHAQLVRFQTSLRQSLRGLKELSKDARKVLASVSGMLGKIQSRLRLLRRSQPKLDELTSRLDELPGVGPHVGIALGNLLQRVSFPGADQAVAFVGLDPRPRDSGKHRGKRKLSKQGPAELRRLLFLAGMAARKTKVFKHLYESYIQRGLASTEAIVILARRILRIAWALATNGQHFDPGKVGLAGQKP